MKCIWHTILAKSNMWFIKYEEEDSVWHEISNLLFTDINPRTPSPFATILPFWLLDICEVASVFRPRSRFLLFNRLCGNHITVPMSPLFF